MCSVRVRPIPSAPNGARLGSVLRAVGVGPHAQAAGPVGPAHQLAVVGVALGVGGQERQGARVDGPARAVHGDRVPFPVGLPAGDDGPAPLVHVDPARADDAALAPAARHERRMARHAALGGEDGVGDVHSVDVLG
jgi:hypothetical protein